MSSNPNPFRDKLDKLLAPDRPLTKDDILWILDYVKKKVAEKDPNLLGLSQPRLLENFHSFAEIALMLIHRRHSMEFEHLKAWVHEATYGLDPEDGMHNSVHASGAHFREGSADSPTPRSS